MDMIRDENFEPNLNITSQARSLNLGPSMNVSNGVFFLNTDAAISHSVTRYHVLSSDTVSAAPTPFLTIRAQRSSPDFSKINGMARG